MGESQKLLSQLDRHWTDLPQRIVDEVDKKTYPSVSRVFQDHAAQLEKLMERARAAQDSIDQMTRGVTSMSDILKKLERLGGWVKAGLGSTVASAVSVVVAIVSQQR